MPITRFRLILARAGAGAAGLAMTLTCVGHSAGAGIPLTDQSGGSGAMAERGQVMPNQAQEPRPGQNQNQGQGRGGRDRPPVDQQHPWDWSNRAPPRGPAPRTLTHETFRSALVNQDVGYWIYLPPNYATEPDRRYPVTYWLHGIAGSEGTGAHLSERLDQMIRAGRTPETIMVFVNGGSGSYYSDSVDGRFPMESLIIRELIPHIDGVFRTIAERRGRSIEGFSMGGMGALKFAAKYPEMFSSVVTYAGAMDSVTSSPRMNNGGYFQLMFNSDPSRLDVNTPAYWVTRNRDRLVQDGMAIRIVSGGEDPTRSGNNEMRALLEQLAIPHEFVELPGVTHVINQYYDAENGLSFAFHARARSRP